VDAAGVDAAGVDASQADVAGAGSTRRHAAGADAAPADVDLTDRVRPYAARPEAMRTDIARADATRPDAVPVVALTADLPAMRPEDLESALVAAARTGQRAFVPDLEGTGTVLLAAPAGQALTPQFGPGSAAAHLRSGAVRLDGAWPSLRRDVDTAADLDAAARLGLGTHTGQVICTVA
jgi:2-phospho-L-lactate guanylyltransferase